jgi:uncharacterized protein DUF4175
VSPDERAVAGAIDATLRRARLFAIAEAVAWGLVAASAQPLGGALVGAVIAVWRWRATRRETILRAIERTHQSSRNLLVTADELAGGRLTASSSMRARVFADAAAIARRLDSRTIVPGGRALMAGAVALVAWAIVMTMPFWRGRLTRIVTGVVQRVLVPDAGLAHSPLRVTVTIRPPAYTGLKDTTTADPEQVQAVEGSMLTVAVDTTAPRLTIEHDGASRSVARGPDGRFVDRIQATRTGYLIVAADAGARRLIPIVVAPDALPSVRITVPGRDLVYAGGNARIAFDARATDDFGLRSLALRYTKVSGSGENFEFQDGEIPLEVKESSARDWAGRASRSLAELGLKDGDMLVYRAVAADARAGDGTGSSDAFVIEISKLGVAAGDAFTLPEEETRYALSQQMLIVKTERLHQRRAAMTPAAVTDDALNLAVEQRMIRAEFVFMLGGEVENEEVEAEQSSELQEGRLQNRGQRDLRAATVAMSRAEKLLTGANTTDALVAERAAVAALQRAFARDRYILRALATRSQLDAARRLTGDLAGAGDWRRVPPDVGENRRAALLQDLLRGIADLARDRGAPRARAAVLAGEAIRIDPESAALRRVATELQRAADAFADEAAFARRSMNRGVRTPIRRPRRQRRRPGLPVRSAMRSSTPGREPCARPTDFHHLRESHGNDDWSASLARERCPSTPRRGHRGGGRNRSGRHADRSGAGSAGGRGAGSDLTRERARAGRVGARSWRGLRDRPAGHLRRGGRDRHRRPLRRVRLQPDRVRRDCRDRHDRPARISHRPRGRATRGAARDGDPPPGRRRRARCRGADRRSHGAHRRP